MNLTRQSHVKRCYKAVVNYCDQQPECGCLLVYDYFDKGKKQVGHIDVFYGEHASRIANVEVSKEFRRQGIATTMLADIVKDMRNDLHPSIKKLVASPNNDSVNILKKLGFHAPECDRNEWVLKVKI